MIGLLYLKEEHVESIKEALARYLHENKEDIIGRLKNYKASKLESSPKI
jgi:hypothetical protein